MVTDILKEKRDRFTPNYLVSPGDIIRDYLVYLGMTSDDLANKTGISQKTIKKILNGKSPITYKIALKLENVLGAPVHFWERLELQYQENKIRLGKRESTTNRLQAEGFRFAPPRERK